eukprot:13016690-Alexandrium_andersonii.AAC.1
MQGQRARERARAHCTREHKFLLGRPCTEGKGPYRPLPSARRSVRSDGLNRPDSWRSREREAA